MELPTSSLGEDRPLVSNLNKANSATGAANDHPQGRALNGHPISQVPSDNSVFINIKNAISRWWTGNRILTTDQLQTIHAARLRHFETDHQNRELSPPVPQRTAADYRATLIGSTFAERQIIRQAAQQAVSQHREELTSSDHNLSSNDRSSPNADPRAALSRQLPPQRQQTDPSQRHAATILQRFTTQSSPVGTRASSQASSSSSLVEHHESESTSIRDDLSEPLLTRLGEISDTLDSLEKEIETQSERLQKAQQNLDEENGKLTQLPRPQFNPSEPRSSQAQDSSAQRKEQDYAYQQSIVEEFSGRVQNESAQLTSLREQHSLLEQQLELVGRIHSAMNPVERRLTELEARYKNIEASKAKIIERGKRLFQEARGFLQEIVTTTLSIAAEQDRSKILARIDEDESAAQLGKANRSLDQAQSPLDPVN